MGFHTCAMLAGRLAGWMSELLVMLRRVLAAWLHPVMPSGTETPKKQREIKLSTTGHCVCKCQLDMMKLHIKMYEKISICFLRYT